MAIATRSVNTSLSHYRGIAEQTRVLAWTMVAASVTVLVLLLGGTFAYSVVACAFLLLCCLAPVVLDAKMKRDAFQPYSFFAVGNVIAFGLPAIVLLFWNPGHGLTDQLPWAALLVSLALLLFSWGYRSDWGPRLASLVPLLAFQSDSGFTESPRVWVTLVITYALGWAGRLAAAAIGYMHMPQDLGTMWQYSGLIDYLRTFGTLSFTLLCFQLLKTCRERPLRLFVTAGLVALEMAAGALDGGRSQIAIGFFYFLLAYSVALRPVRFRTLVMVYVLAFTFFAPVLTMYRNSYYSAISSDSSTDFSKVNEATGSMMSDLVKGRYSWRELSEMTILDRGTGTMQGCLRVIGMVPDRVPYEMGGSFLPGLLPMVVPRIFWPNKPIFQPTRIFAERFFSTEVGQRFGTNTGIGMPAEAYYNFGWFGLLMFPPLGLILRFYTTRYEAYRRLEPTYIVRLCFVILVVANITTTFLYFVMGILQQAIVYLLFLLLLHVRLPVAYRMQAPAPR
jgi:hypothetical protein